MKKEYVTPSAYFEMFTPNQYAGNCQPGIPETDLTPNTVDCVWNNRSATRTIYNFNPSSGCRQESRESISGCSMMGNSLSLMTNLCQVDFSGNEAYGTGVAVKYVKISGYGEGAMYSWPNGKGGTHQAMASEVIPGQSYDPDGRPYYFNS
ncbi:MAG: hypothetical protein MJ116_11185 [Lachnospiraceae bacterium]|nr:hypothetical protein [Lachnospiraceae bacterium]